MKAVQDQSAKMHTEIRNQEKKIIEEIKQIQQDRNRTYDEHQKTLKTMQQSKQHSLSTSHDIIHNASDTDFWSLYPVIGTDLKSLKSQTPPQIDAKLSYMSFTPGQRIGDINLGKLEVKGQEMCAEFGEEGSSQKGLVWAEGVTASQPGDINLGKLAVKDREMCAEFGEEGSSQKGLVWAEGVTATQPGDISLGKLAVKAKWEMCAEFGKRGSVLGRFGWARDVTATQPGEIAVADNGKNRVVICSNEGQHKATIPLQHPWAVAAIHNPEQRLLVLEWRSKYVKVFNMKDNKLAIQFPTVPPSQAEETQVDLGSLAVRKNGTVLVGDVKNNVLSEHEFSPTGCEILRTILVQTPPHYLAVDDDMDRIVVSGDDKEKTDVLDGEGNPLSTIRPTINGQPAECRGVHCNSSGIHIVVDQGWDCNGHIHLYDLDGRFVDCLAQGLHNPWESHSHLMASLPLLTTTQSRCIPRCKHVELAV